MKWLIFSIILAAVGVLILSQIGNLFIREVTREIKIEDRGAIAEAGVGKPAPHFELPDLEGPPVGEAGAKVKPPDYLGSPVVITFWATWNTSSADQIKIFDEYLAKKGESLFKIIAISSQEDKSAVSNFIKRGGYKVKVLLDETGDITEQYRARSLPATYFVDKDGILRDVFIGILSEKMILEKVEKVLK